MKKAILMLFAFSFGTGVTPAQPPSQSPVDSKIVTAAQVNGTWGTKHSEFKLWALGGQKIKVEFSGVYEYKTPGGPMANTGEGWGIAHIEGDTATFKPEVSEPECEITMKFTAGRLRVSQVGICGFGHNVTAEGDYRRVSRSRPKFRKELTD